MKIYVVGGATHYANFIKDATLVSNLEEADVVLFTGGEDVSPSLYGCTKHRTTHSNLKRDKEEKKIFDQVKLNQLCLGICRGSQLMSVLNGGLLVQNCGCHATGYTHGITNGKVIYEITSTHHQMQYPYNLPKEDYDLLFTAFGVGSDYYEGDKIDPEEILDNGEPEIVLYHKQGLPKCLAVQGHPEMIPNSPVAEMISNLITKLVNENN